MNSVFRMFVAVFAVVFATSFAQAEVRSELKSLDTVSFDGKILEFSYSIGGGCQKHWADAELTYDEVTYTATVSVFDVSEVLDMCESFVYGEGRIDVQQMVKDVFKSKGLKNNYLILVLPTISMRLD